MQKTPSSKDERGDLPWYHPGSAAELGFQDINGFCRCTL